MSEYTILGLADDEDMGPYKIMGPAEEQSAGMPMQPGIGGIGNDIRDSMINLLFKGAEKAAQLPLEAASAFSQLKDNPIQGGVRASRGVLSGLGEGVKGLYNLPLELGGYLGKKDIFPFNYTAPYTNKLKIGDTGLEQKLMGAPQEGDQLWKDIGEFGPMLFAPETLLGKSGAVTSRGIMNKLAQAKEKQMGIARTDYGKLFEDASNQGLTHAEPLPEVIRHQEEIVKNSHPKYHTSLNKYLESPTIENAHWAQSELGALQRHLDSISSKNGLTPSQVQTYKAVNEARNGIKKSMFSENALGNNPVLGMRYGNLANKYRENVVPYTSLEDLSEFQAGRMRPKTSVKNLLNNEEFMINLSKKYPGIFLHTPTARNIGIGTAGLLGYDELKKLLNSGS